MMCAMMNITEHGHTWCDAQPADRKCYYYHQRWKRSGGSRPRKTIKFKLRKRDGDGCVYCGVEGYLTVDHVIPKAAGGTNHLSNLVLACKDCNNKKGDLPVNHPKVKALRRKKRSNG